jgi:hypothetical protein
MISNLIAPGRFDELNGVAFMYAQEIKNEMGDMDAIAVAALILETVLKNTPDPLKRLTIKALAQDFNARLMAQVNER